MLQEPLLRAIIARARQAGQEQQHGHFAERVPERLRRQEEVERHVAGGGPRGVRELEERAAEGGERGGGAEGHRGGGAEGWRRVFTGMGKERG